MTIIPLLPEHWPWVSAIFQQGIDTKLATFEVSPPEWEYWDKSHTPHSRLVAEKDGNIIGWAALIPVSDRCVYGGVAELSIYIDANYRGQQVGQKLMEALIESSEQNGIWTLQSQMFPKNKGSLELHKKAGFRTVGVREKLGKLDDVWLDVILLERRSAEY